MIDIILPVHNSKPHLRATIESLLSSTNYPFRLLLIESESTDGTDKYCDGLSAIYENVKVFHIPKKGLVNAINFGIQQSENDVYITQDDVIHFRLYGMDWLADMVDMSRHKQIAMITGLYGGGVSGKDYIDGFRWVGTWNMFLPRKTIKKVGMFDENMGPGDDIDYCYRCKEAGLKFAVCPFWVQHHRLTEHGDVDSKNKQKQMSDYFKRKHKL